MDLLARRKRNFRGKTRTFSFRSRTASGGCWRRRPGSCAAAANPASAAPVPTAPSPSSAWSALPVRPLWSAGPSEWAGTRASVRRYAVTAMGWPCRASARMSQPVCPSHPTRSVNGPRWMREFSRRHSWLSRRRSWRMASLIVAHFPLWKTNMMESTASTLCNVDWINQSINRTINQWINQSINQSMDQSINHSLTHSLNQSTNQSTNQSINQSINQACVTAFDGRTTKTYRDVDEDAAALDINCCGCGGCIGGCCETGCGVNCGGCWDGCCVDSGRGMPFCVAVKDVVDVEDGATVGLARFRPASFQGSFMGTAWGVVGILPPIEEA